MGDVPELTGWEEYKIYPEHWALGTWKWDQAKLEANHMNTEIAQKAYEQDMNPENVIAQQQWKKNPNPARHSALPEPGPSSYDGRGPVEIPDSYAETDEVPEVPVEESNVPILYVVGFGLLFLIFWICAYVCYMGIQKRNDTLRTRANPIFRRRLIKTPFSKLADELGVQYTSKSPQIETIAQESYEYQDFVRECVADKNNLLWIVPVTVLEKLFCAYVLYKLYRTCRRTRT